MIFNAYNAFDLDKKINGKYKNNLAPWIIIITIAFLLVIMYVPQVHDLFELSNLSVTDFFIAVLIAVITTGWPEIYKTYRSPR